MELAEHFSRPLSDELFDKGIENDWMDFAPIPIGQTLAVADPFLPSGAELTWAVEQRIGITMRRVREIVERLLHSGRHADGETHVDQ